MIWTWDLAAILVLLVLVSGMIWLYDSIRLAPRRLAAKAKLTEHASKADLLATERLPFIVDLARSLFPVFLIVLLLRSFLVEPFRIPSGSMMPTLLTGDFILVNKFSYGVRLPVINLKIIDIASPQRGDVMVFRYPKDPAIPFIKRVVGLPGDHIAYHNDNKMLYVNGEPVMQKAVEIFQGTGSGSDMTGKQVRIEYLYEKEHSILVDSDPEAGYPSHMEYKEMTVPDGHYFVIGDNRDNSRDSRFWGTVPEANLVGKAFFIWMNWDAGSVHLDRIGKIQ